MQQTDADPFRNIMRGMCKLFGQEPDAVLLDAYWLALGNWTLAEFSQAAGHLMANSKFMPRPADFNELRKAGRPTAGEAWAKVLHYVRTGLYRWDYPHEITRNNAVAEPTDRLMTRAVEALGGYKAIAFTDEDKLHFLERRFSEHYESIQDAEEVREAIPELTAPESLKRLFDGVRSRQITDERV